MCICGCYCDCAIGAVAVTVTVIDVDFAVRVTATEIEQNPANTTNGQFATLLFLNAILLFNVIPLLTKVKCCAVCRLLGCHLSSQRYLLCAVQYLHSTTAATATASLTLPHLPCLRFVTQLTLSDFNVSLCCPE